MGTGAVATRDGARELVAAIWLRGRRKADPLVAHWGTGALGHWGTVNHVQSHPRFRGGGIGAALMTRSNYRHIRTGQRLGGDQRAA